MVKFFHFGPLELIHLHINYSFEAQPERQSWEFDREKYQGQLIFLWQVKEFWMRAGYILCY